MRNHSRFFYARGALSSFHTAWAVNGGWLVELHRDWAVFELAENGSRRIFDRLRLEAGNIRLPWIEA